MEVAMSVGYATAETTPSDLGTLSNLVLLNTNHTQYLGNRSLEVICFHDLSTSEYTEAKKAALNFTLSIRQLMFLVFFSFFFVLFLFRIRRSQKNIMGTRMRVTGR